MTEKSEAYPSLEAIPHEELIRILKEVRTIAWIGFADGRTVADKNHALREISVKTAFLGND